MNHSKTAYDVVNFFNNSPTSNDMILSEVTGLKCRTINIVKNKDICNEKSSTEKMKEYVKSYYTFSNDTGIIY